MIKLLLIGGALSVIAVSAVFSGKILTSSADHEMKSKIESERSGIIRTISDNIEACAKTVSSGYKYPDITYKHTSHVYANTLIKEMYPDYFNDPDAADTALFTFLANEISHLPKADMILIGKQVTGILNDRNSIECLNESVIANGV